MEPLKGHCDGGKNISVVFQSLKGAELMAGRNAQQRSTKQ